MPKRIVDGDALWRSQRLKKVEPPKYRGEVANLLPLALANGVFEADPPLVWAQVFAYNRPDVTPDDVVAMLDQFESAKMLFRWDDASGKQWGYWIDIDKPGRLPPPSERNREKRGPEPPADRLREFLGASYPAPTQVLGGSSAERNPCEEDGSLRIRTGIRTGTGTGLRTATGTGNEAGAEHVVGASSSSSSSSPSSSSPVEPEEDICPRPEFEAPPLPQVELADIRDWRDDRFGVSGERLRNCILYQLDYAENDWYRVHPVTVDSLNRPKFVAKIDAETPKGWTPEKAKTANKPVSGKEAQTARKTDELLAKFGAKVNEAV